MVGVGSVGTRCFVVVLEGRDEGDPLILQAKEATASVLEPYARRAGTRTTASASWSGSGSMQATSDIFLGWTRGHGGRDFYFRQLWDMKGSVDITTLHRMGSPSTVQLCAWALAGAHARTGDAVAIAGYLGSGDTFDGAIADFAEAYADQNQTDYAAFKDAIASGRLKAVPATA